MIGKWILLLAGVVVLAMILVTGYQPEAVAASESALQELYKAAKAEGKVIWQYQSSLDEVKDLAGAFQAKYPEIKLTVFSFSAARMATRIIGEAAGKKLTLDAGTLRPYLLLPLIERDLLVKYDWTKVGIPQGDILLDGAFVNMFESPYVWLRNTNLVSEAEAPKTWEDVLHPKWKGHKISVRNSPSTFFPLFLTWKKDKQKAIDYINRFKQQEAVAGNRTIEVTNRIAN